ncbi:MAG: 2-oxoacid:acceptor oxidoreductase family protein [Desulfocapsaceae bacterium]
MDNERIICAGFGGQGVMSLGKLIAYAAMLDGRHVTWMPSYGPEMRGGTANCSVVVADQPVGSPIVTRDATSLIVMNLPSFEKFQQSVIAGGLILFNRSLIDHQVERYDVMAQPLKANELAAECSNPRAANMVMLGAFMGLRGAPRLHHAAEAMKKVFGDGSSAQFNQNMKAVRKGMEAVGKMTETRKAA